MNSQNFLQVVRCEFVRAIWIKRRLNTHKGTDLLDFLFSVCRKTYHISLITFLLCQKDMLNYKQDHLHHHSITMSNHQKSNTYLLQDWYFAFISTFWTERPVRNCLDIKLCSMMSPLYGSIKFPFWSTWKPTKVIVTRSWLKNR